MSNLPASWAASLLLAGAPLARFTLAAALGLLLYLLLAEPRCEVRSPKSDATGVDGPGTEGETGASGLRTSDFGLSPSVLRRLLFAALGVLVFWLLTAPRPTSRVGQGRGFEAYSRAMLSARMAFTSSSLLRADPSPGPISMKNLRAAIHQYERAARAAPDSATYHRELAVLYAVSGRWADAGREGEAAAALGEKRDEATGRLERWLWQTLAGPERARTAQLAQLHRAIDRLPFGWLRPALRYALALRLERPEEADEQLVVLSRAANDYLLRVFSLIIIQLALTIIGAILLLVLAVLMATGVLRRVPPHLAPVSAILLEGFILYMLLNAAPGLPFVGHALGLRGAARSPGTVVLTALLMDALGLLALAYVAWRLRRRGLTLAEIGLHTHRWKGDLLWGLAGYIAILPVLLATALVTEQLTRRYFPNVAPPYHPVSGLMLASPGIAVRLGLLALVAVGAPLFEEIFFRGALYGALRRRLGPVAGALLSAVVFAILHPQLPLGFVPIFLLGATFAFLYEWRQSLLPGITMHALNNGFIFVLMTALFPMRG